MTIRAKRDFPVEDVRRHLEPGPIVLVTSAWRGRTNVMTLGWQTVMEFTPSLVGCIISNANYSFELIRKSEECVINVPTIELIEAVVGIGNSSGAEMDDKLAAFGLTAKKAARVDAPLIAECYASFECRLADAALIERYNFFIFEVVKAHVAATPKNPRTIHYRGHGEFMIAGRSADLSDQFKPDRL